MLAVMHPITESIIYNYKLHTENDSIEKLHYLTKEDVAIHSHIYKE